MATNKPKDITFHYTNQEMVNDLLSFLNLPYDVSICDAGSGKNKVWYNTVNVKEKYECELEEGNDFFEFNKKVDWVIGNPPFHLGWKFTEKAMQVANQGIAFLLNNQGLNSNNTPKRIQQQQEMGFYLHHIRVVSDARWFGRYYFLVYKKESNNVLSFNLTNFSK